MQVHEVFPSGHDVRSHSDECLEFGEARTLGQAVELPQALATPNSFDADQLKAVRSYKVMQNLLRVSLNARVAAQVLDVNDDTPTLTTRRHPTRDGSPS